MRSLFSFGASKEMPLAMADSGHRPEILRRKTLATNARVLIAIGAIALPFAIYAMITSSVLPFVLASFGLFGGMTALALHQKQQFEASAAIQVYLLLAIGFILTLSDQSFGDAGLAVSVMAPILAALVGRQNLRRQAWIAGGAVLALAGVASLFSFGLAAQTDSMLLPSAMLTFVLVMGMMIFTANRISLAYEVYDKAQVNAYRHLIEHVQDAVIRFSSAGDVLMASRSSETLFGCRRYELSGSGLGERLHVMDRPAYLTAFADANQAGLSRVIEVRMRQDVAHPATAVPRFIWVEISLSPIIEGSAKSERHEVIALMRDITGRKDAEAAMAEARREAEEASAAKSRFLATIGHELRTPLNAVVGFSEMMTSGIGGELSPTHREYAGLIHQSGKHLLEVVRMLLDMSRLEAGKFELQAEPFQIADIVEPCFRMVEALAQSRDIRLVTEVGKHLPMLVADERACRQILLNLLSNAVKFSHPGGVVTVSLKRQGVSLNLSVRDHGVGMAPESLERIGEPFFQAQDGLARRYEGTGLGLSIVKGLVDLHQGTLRAMSEIGVGTTVTVLLPINGPAIKTDETAVVTPIRKELAAESDSLWPEEKRKAQ